MIGGFQPRAFQPAYQQVRADEERPAGGYTRATRRTRWRRKWFDELPSAEEVREQREALGVLPKRAQAIVAKVVKSASDVSTPEQAANLAVAYTQETQQRRLMDRLRRETSEANLKWRDEMFAAAQALILDALMRRAERARIEQLIAYEAQERDEINDILQIWMQL
jgi:hypothetical protein